jgi:hypothetical protein
MSHIENNLENENEEIKFVRTYSGASVPESEATYYEAIGYWLTDEEYEQLTDDGRLVYDHYHDEHNWECDLHYGYINSRGGTGYFSSDADYCYINNGDVNYAINTDIASANGFYEHQDGEWYDEPEEDEEEWIWRYHSDRRTWLASDNATWRIAFEVEKEDYNMLRYESADECFDRTGWAKEYDGSLNDAGFEFISPVYDLSSITKDTFKDVANYLSADISTRCGGHVNLSHVSLTARELYQSIKSYMPLLYALYNGRASNRYCPAVSKHSEADEKYGAVYVRGSRLEFRIFSAVRNVENLMWRISLIRYMLDNRDVSEAAVLKSMLDGRSKLHAILRKVYSVDDIIKKGKMFYDFCRNYSFDIKDTQDVLVKRKLMKKPKVKKSKTGDIDPRWYDAIMIFDESELTLGQLDEFFNSTDSPMTTLPVVTN